MNFIVIFLAYLCGSLSSAIITCKVMGLPDPRSAGSHNPGATNVLRIGGKKAAAFTFIGDALKGVIPVALAKWAGLDLVIIGLVGFSAFIGHLYPLFFRFQGGKGVATAVGVTFTISWVIGLLWIGTWLSVAFLFGYSSLAALVAGLLSPLYFWAVLHNKILTLIMLVMNVLLIYKHKENIKRLVNGTETKIKKKS